eukprot:440760-Amphidinium_carterae.2
MIQSTPPSDFTGHLRRILFLILLVDGLSHAVQGLEAFPICACGLHWHAASSIDTCTAGNSVSHTQPKSPAWLKRLIYTEESKKDLKSSYCIPSNCNKKLSIQVPHLQKSFLKSSSPNQLQSNVTLTDLGYTSPPVRFYQRCA